MNLPSKLKKEKNKMLSKDEYIERNGLLCPYCQSTNLNSNGKDYDENCIKCYVSCSNCGELWTEIYILDDIWFDN